ncbi:hypothetical protein JB92DRAFT_1072339 [Gautieria morchelliformis]|nr:hypothetical protein JB92DRAFT_1072339 [Gautieria morchelliformis]
MPNPRPKTPPPPPPAYDVNQDVILLVDAGENFPIHTHAKVQSQMSLNAPGVNTPLTAQNASYRVGVMVRMEVDAETGPLIESSMIPHQHLSRTRDGRQHIILFRVSSRLSHWITTINRAQINEYAYLIAPWKYKRQGNEILLRNGTKVQICDEAHTKAGSTTTRLDRACYRIKVVKTRVEENMVQSSIYIPHAQLQSISQAYAASKKL